MFTWGGGGFLLRAARDTDVESYQAWSMEQHIATTIRVCKLYMVITLLYRICTPFPIIAKRKYNFTTHGDGMSHKI